MTNPFPKLTEEARLDPDDKLLSDELSAYLTSAATTKPKKKLYDFYEYIGESGTEKGGDASA